MSSKVLQTLSLAGVISVAGGIVPCSAARTSTAVSVVAAPSNANPWDGGWVLDLRRSSAIAKEGAAEDYRFKLEADGRIRWEIPSLGEVVTGHTDGQPMLVHRPSDTHGLTISVRRDGPWGLLYDVADANGPQGGGRMTLIDGGRAWVDLTWGPGHREPGYAFVYVKR